MSSTICALATPPGAGGIAVVRVSGPEAYAVVGEIFTPRNPAKRVAEAKGYTAMLGLLDTVFPIHEHVFQNFHPLKIK